ncbi:MAG: hypothetical protein KAT65_29970, partial [Methanophagales archaeon]|nr:hypothetical protein [Methanophagales archaeon]
ALFTVVPNVNLSPSQTLFHIPFAFHIHRFSRATFRDLRSFCMCLGETRNNQGDRFVYDGKISKSKRKLLEG